MAHLVTGNYFDVLRRAPRNSRGFLPEEDAGPGARRWRSSATPLWQRLYNGDARVTANSIELQRPPVPHRGSGPEGFLGLTSLFGADLLCPCRCIRDLPGPDPGAAAAGASVRRRRTAQAGDTFAQAGAAMQSLAQELEREYPNENRGRRMRVAPIARLR